MSRLSLKNDFKDGDILYGGQLNTNNKATMVAVNDNYEKITGLQSLKADVSDVNEKLAGKVDVETFNDEINSLNTTKANVSLVNTKADKTEVALKADKTYVDSQLANKAEKAYVDSQISQNVGNLSASLESKADKTYVDTSLDTKVNSSDYFVEMYAKADKTTVGNLSDLKTSNKSSIVGAINSVQTKPIPVATTSVAGTVKPDGNTVKIEPDGTISAIGEEVYIGETEPTNENVKVWLDPSGEASVDTVMSDTSTNPVQNKVIKQYVDSHSSSGGGASYTAGDGIDITNNVISSTVQVPTKTSELTNDSGYLTETPAETDPVFNASPASKITDEDITNWNNAGGGGGASYTAGNNIEITEDNVINNTIPYANTPNTNISETIEKPTIKSGRNGCLVLGSNATATEHYGIAIGDNTKATGSSVVIGSGAMADLGNCVAIGGNAGHNSKGEGHVFIGQVATSSYGNYGIAIGWMTVSSGDNTIAIGKQANTSYRSNSIALGAGATNTKNNQMMVGSTSNAINEIVMTTSDGAKTVATTDLIDALTTRINELETRIATLEGNV